MCSLCLCGENHHRNNLSFQVFYQCTITPFFLLIYPFYIQPAAPIFQSESIVKSIRIPMKNALHITVKILIFLSFQFLVATANAQQWNSVQDGNWNNPATWGGTSYPPATLNSGKHVNIRHSVTINSSFASTLSINNGASINIEGGTFNVGTGISMDNRGRFTGINGYLLQCLFVGCGTSGSQASGVWNTLDGGYTRMQNMTIEIAQDWATTNGGKRYMKDCCVKTGQNFSVNNEMNRDTLINTRFVLGLHGSGNFQQNKGKVIYDNIDIDIAGSDGGNVQFSGGTFSGKIRTIRIVANNGNIQTSSSMSGTIDLDFYCIQNASNFEDPSNKIKNEMLDCGVVESYLILQCISAMPIPPGEEEGPDRRLFGVINTEEPKEIPAAIAKEEISMQESIERVNLTAYPNPFVQKIEMDYQLYKSSMVTITLNDFTGRQIYRATKTGSEGINKVVIDNLSSLHPGLYILSVHTPEGVIKRNKIVKK